MENSRNLIKRKTLVILASLAILTLTSGFSISCSSTTTNASEESQTISKKQHVPAAPNYHLLTGEVLG